MSFYRKYRPQTIEELDNPMVAEELFKLTKKNRSDLPHAYLFYGPRGTGKTTTARLVAKMLNCLKPSKTGAPCGKCEMCLSIAQSRNLDILEIDAASNRGIDEIRELKNSISLSPVQSKVKVYIIDEVHMLTTEAFNALLKTLEEPPAHAVFVLATTDPQKVPATIHSRCVVIQFHRASAPELKQSLLRIIQKEKIKIDEEALASIIVKADGSFRDGAKLLEQVSLSEGPITINIVQKVLSITSQRSKEDFLTHLVKRQASEALADVRSLVTEGKDMRAFIVECLSDLEQLLLLSAAGEAADAWSQRDLKDIIQKLSLAFAEMRLSPIASLPLEVAVIEFCQAPDGPAVGSFGVSKPKADESDPKRQPAQQPAQVPVQLVSGLLTTQKLEEHWNDFIVALKPYNHSVAGVLRSSRPKAVKDGLVTIEAFYRFHQEKLSETKTREMLAQIINKLFGQKVKVDVVLGKK